MGSAKSQVDRNTANTIAIYHLTGAKPCGNHALLLDENVCCFFFFLICAVVKMQYVLHLWEGWGRAKLSVLFLMGK